MQFIVFMVFTVKKYVRPAWYLYLRGGDGIGFTIAKASTSLKTGEVDAFVVFKT